jgi:hypothetical protein
MHADARLRPERKCIYHLCRRRAPRSVLVLKKLGDELLADFVRVLRFLGAEEGMRVVVEPHEYIRLVGRAGLGFIDTYTPAEAVRCGPAGGPQPALSRVMARLFPGKFGVFSAISVFCQVVPHPHSLWDVSCTAQQDACCALCLTRRVCHQCLGTPPVRTRQPLSAQRRCTCI